ncbi:hypothetical protein EV182_005960 [Spiromyces aspiralis]|uniref:Uncharacterized protein n=1 Tax=Spiromyces aspiralis TaxID=68401 RepID=A0ACC1HAQ6_9FUNG|nr:hypothetical protein EV182_005960 [Spiromyces aspiralis]
MPDLVTNKPKVKLYRDSEGKLKGDALVTYYKAPSVQLAIDILDDTPFRDVDPKKPDQQVWKVHVQVAEFKAKDTLDERRSAEGAEDQSQARKVRKLDPKLVKRKLEQMEKKLDWFEGPTQMAEKHQKVVILKHMFTPQELEEDVTLLIDLKEDVREECEKLGEVTNVKIYDKEDEGVISVKFRDKMSAAACVKVMNGRFFAGRQIEASLYDGRKKYRSTKKDEETEKQVEQRMENYAKWLESSKS